MLSLLCNAAATLARMGASAAAVALAVGCACGVLRHLRAPAAISAALWLAVAFRLLCPVGLALPVSLFGVSEISAATSAAGQQAQRLADATAAVAAGAEQSGNAANAAGMNDPVGAGAQAGAKRQTGGAATVTVGQLLALVWLAGAAVLFVRSAADAVRLHRCTRFAWRVTAPGGCGSYYTGEEIRAPFSAGWLAPRIYLPGGLSAEETEYILLHERAHLRRGDAVLRCLGDGVKHAYCESLLRFAVPPAPRGAAAFGAGGVKARIVAILHYKRPKVGLVIGCAAGAMLLFTACLADPASGQPPVVQLPAQAADSCDPGTLAEPEGESAADSAADGDTASSSAGSTPDAVRKEETTSATAAADAALALAREKLTFWPVPMYRYVSRVMWPATGTDSADSTGSTGSATSAPEPVDVVVPETMPLSEGGHRGTDIAAPPDEEIIAMGDGTVLAAGYGGSEYDAQIPEVLDAMQLESTEGYGYLVILDHGDGVYTLYAHNAENCVKTGDTVAAGQKIATVGSTGRSTGNHCHVEIRADGQWAVALLAVTPYPR